MKTINLDEFAAEKRTITLNGKEHEVREMTVTDFVEASVEADKIEADGVRGVRENAEDTIMHLHRAIPTLAVEELRRLSVAQMSVLLAFVNGSLQAEMTKGVEASGN